jgi:hypothetical protein
VLILYSTIGVWLFGYSEIEMYKPANEVDKMIEKNLENCAESCLFYYMKAKYYQFLVKDTDKALELYQVTLRNARKAREIESLMFYEMTFLHLTNLDYVKAKENFMPFSEVSHWSRIFNAYVKILINGSLNDFENFNENLIKAVETPTKRNPIDFYASKRLQYLLKNESEITKELCEFFIIELLYLWVLIPFCNEDKRNNMIQSKRVKVVENKFSQRT